MVVGSCCGEDLRCFYARGYEIDRGGGAGDLSSLLSGAHVSCHAISVVPHGAV